MAAYSVLTRGPMPSLTIAPQAQAAGTGLSAVQTVLPSQTELSQKAVGTEFNPHRPERGQGRGYLRLQEWRPVRLQRVLYSRSE